MFANARPRPRKKATKVRPGLDQPTNAPTSKSAKSIPVFTMTSSIVNRAPEKTGWVSEPCSIVSPPKLSPVARISTGLRLAMIFLPWDEYRHHLA